MDKPLIDLKVGELLLKFGAGNHKPGLGSASALHGMLAAQMLLTVIDLTGDPKRQKRYEARLTRLNSIKQQIESSIYPRLEILFQEDSNEFDRVIKHRNLRDEEPDAIKKRQLSEDLQPLTKRATEIPLEIADLCLEIVEFGDEVFDHGFRSARGDAGVALNGALAGVISCLSIIELNILSLPADDWMDKAVAKKVEIRARYNRLSSKGDEKLKVLEAESDKHLQFQKAITKFRRGNLASSISSDAQLEKLVRELQNLLWAYRESIWKTNAPDVPFGVLQPRIVLEKVLRYVYYESADLGKHEIDGEWFETAGIINNRIKSVGISTNFPPATQLFSLAHELGHAILHDKAVLHRDRSIDGSGDTNRSPEERQADRFAAYFLLPKTALLYVFEGIFHMPVFTINQSTALALGAGHPSDFRNHCQDVMGLAKVIASVNQYGGAKFTPMAEAFGVSVPAMAIRLVELGLVQF